MGVERVPGDTAVRKTDAIRIGGSTPHAPTEPGGMNNEVGTLMKRECVGGTLTQMEENPPFKRSDGGSSPPRPTSSSRVRSSTGKRPPLKRRDEGSTPSGPTAYSGIVQPAGHEALNLAMRVRTALPEPLTRLAPACSLTTEHLDLSGLPSPKGGPPKRGGLARDAAVRTCRVPRFRDVQERPPGRSRVVRTT